MQRFKQGYFQAMLIASGCLAMGPAGAEDASGTVSLAAPASSATFAKPVSLEQLDDHRGGADTLAVNEQKLSATLSRNTAADLSTGTNSINEGSFMGASGFPMVIQNSGNNVIIQNSTILNLNLK